MSETNKLVKLEDVVKGQLQKSLQKQNEEKPTVYRYEIFKGEEDSKGKIVKTKVVGSAYNREGLKTYTVNLKTFLNDTFYLLPNTRPKSSDVSSDFVILTREPGQNIGRKYFWNSVGECKVLDGVNAGVMRLSWDVFFQDLYMQLYPINVTGLPESEKAEAAA